LIDPLDAEAIFFALKKMLSHAFKEEKNKREKQ